MPCSLGLILFWYSICPLCLEKTLLLYALLLFYVYMYVCIMYVYMYVCICMCAYVCIFLL